MEPSDPQALEELDRRGWLRIEQAVAPELLDELESRLRELERAPTSALPRGVPRSFTPVLNEVRLLNLVECGTPFEHLIDHPSFLPWVRAVVPGPQRVTTSHSITRARGTGLPLHRLETALYRREAGRPRCDHLTAIVWLSDVGPEDGPMVLFEGTHLTGLAPACAPIDPSWALPEHDAASVHRYREEARRFARTPWREVAGYHEIHVRRGDVILFAEALWHGAQAVVSERVRRSLYLSYAPYHCANWHGLTYSPELLARVGAARRTLLSGPYIGHRYDVWPTAGVPDLPEFPCLSESDLGVRAIAASADSTRERAAVERAFTEAERRFREDPCELAGVRGRLHVVAGDGGPWTVECGDELRHRAGLQGTWDVRVEFVPGDPARILAGERDPVDLFNQGRVRAEGQLALAMRWLSFLLP